MSSKCTQSHISMTMCLVILCVFIVVLSTLDFHTSSIWGLGPCVNAEIRYVTTVVGFIIVSQYIYYSPHTSGRRDMNGGK